MTIKKVGLISKPKISGLEETINEVISWFSARGVEAILDIESAQVIGHSEKGLDRHRIPAMVDLIVVLGGDGTILSVGYIAAEHDVPLIGVNMGGLGFLAETMQSEMYESFEKVLNGDYESSSRHLINAKLIRKGKTAEIFEAVNDVVMDNTAMARMIESEIHVNGDFVIRFRADGLIISTPTGSTAYSLSAGGPILYPEIEALIITPICPHTMTYRPLVVSGNSTIELITNTMEGQSYLTVDGQRGIELKRGDRLIVTLSSYKLKLVKSFTKNYFQILSEKLHWGSEGKKV